LNSFKLPPISHIQTINTTQLWRKYTLVRKVVS
jgi:hypothetical protein